MEAMLFPRCNNDNKGHSPYRNDRKAISADIGMGTCSRLNVCELTDHAHAEQTIVCCSGVGVSRGGNLERTTNVPHLDPLPLPPEQQEDLPDSRSSRSALRP